MILLAGCVTTPEPPPPPPPAPLPVWQPARRLAPPLTVSGSALLDSQGNVNGGRLRHEGDNVGIDVVVGPGRYAGRVRARADGGEGVVQVRLDDIDVATLTVPTGTSEQTFELQSTGWKEARLSLRFANDPDGSREIAVQEVSLRGALPRAVRQSRLRDALKGRSVLLVSIDTLRADHLGTYGYRRDTSPTLDRLAARGVRFERAYATSHWTAPAHASMLTGLHAPEHGVRSFPMPEAIDASVQTASQRFTAAGYESVWFAGGGYVSEDLGMARGATVLDEGGAMAAQRFQRVADWLSTRGDGPFFAFVHTYQVHDPYDPPAAFSGWARDAPAWLRTSFEDTFFQGRTATPAELALLEGLYDGEIRYTDAHLGALLTAVPDDTLIMVTSDHGEEFLDYGNVGHSNLREALVRVPWIVSHPALIGTADHVDAVVSGVDLLPTVLDLVGLPTTGTSGRSRVPEMLGEPAADFVFATSQMHRPQQTAIDARGQLVIEGGTEQPYGEVGEAHRAALATWAAGLRPSPTAEPAPLDASRREELRALGYLASTPTP